MDQENVDAVPVIQHPSPQLERVFKTEKTILHLQTDLQNLSKTVADLSNQLVMLGFKSRGQLVELLNRVEDLEKKIKQSDVS